MTGSPNRLTSQPLNSPYPLNSMKTTGKISMVNGNMISVLFDGAVAQNEVGYALLGG